MANLILNSLNVNGWSEGSREIKMRLITHNNPDIICLCETHLTHFEYINIPQYKYYGKARQGLKKSGGVAILIKDDTFQEYSIELVCADTDGIIAVKLIHDFTEYETVIVCNYLPPSNSIYGKDPESFYTRLLMLAYECNSVDVLIYCGDFNARIGHIQDAPYADVPERKIKDKSVNTHGREFLNFLSDSGCCTLNGRLEETLTYTCATSQGSSVVDYIVMPYDNLNLVNSFEVKTINTLVHKLGLEPMVALGAGVPDHNMLTLDFRSSGQQISVKGLGTKNTNRKSVPRKFSAQYMTNDRVINAMSQTLERITKMNHTQDEIDKNYESLCDVITTEMDLNKKRTKRKHTPHKPYWTDALSELWTNMQKCFKQVKNKLKGVSKRQLNRMTSNDSEILKYKKAVNDFDRELRSAKQRHSVNKIEEMDFLTGKHNPKMFWEEINKLGPRTKKQTVCEALDPAGNVTRHRGTVRIHWEKEFTHLYTDPPEGVFDDEFYTKQLVELESRNTETNSCPSLNCDISMEEVKRAVANSKLRKAYGNDKIPNESLKNTLCIRAIHVFINAVFDTGMIPSEWRKSIIVPISKGKKTLSHKPLTHRGLALQSCIYKIYSSVLNARLTTYLEEGELIEETQNGFRKKRSCIDHIYTLSETIRMNTSTPQSKVYACFVDLRRAFDEIDRNLALLNLNNIGLSGRFYSALCAIYKNPVCRVRLNGEDTTDWIRSNYGTIQGDVISPQIFSSQINIVIKKLNESGNGIYYGSGINDNFACLAFADDLVLVAPTEAKLQSLVNILYDHCSKYRMSVNVDKTKTMVFRKNHQTGRPEIIIRYGSREIEQVRSYKYLGIYFDECLKFNQAEEELASAAGRALGSVIGKTREHRDLGIKTFTKICNGCINPIIDYSCEVLGHSTGKSLSDVQLRACRFYLGVPRNTPLPCLTAELGWLPTGDRRKKGVLRFYNRLLEMDDNRIPKKVFLNSVNNDTSWAGKTRKLLEDIGLGIYWNTGSRVPKDLMNFHILEKYKERWRSEVLDKVKLKTYSTIKISSTVSGYIASNLPKRQRSILAQLCMGVLKLKIETGRYVNQDLRDRTCEVCSQNAVENESHFLFECEAYDEERTNFFHALGLRNYDNIDLKMLYSKPFMFSKYVLQIWNKRNRLLCD